MSQESATGINIPKLFFAAKSCQVMFGRRRLFLCFAGTESPVRAALFAWRRALNCATSSMRRLVPAPRPLVGIAPSSVQSSRRG
jgi:hypothetical protein